MGIIQPIHYINLNIVECRAIRYPERVVVLLDINLNIVECRGQSLTAMFGVVTILI